MALFTKMLRVGVPEDAVRQLMILRGAGNAGAYQALFGAQAELRVAKAMARTPEQCAFNIDASLSSHYAEELLLKPSSRMYDNLFASTVQYWHVQVKAQTGPTELCEICFNNVSEGLIIKKCQMGVAYCTDCVVEFLEGDITVARVSEHGCACLCRSCDSIFTEDEIKNFVSDETMDKFIKFRNAKLVQVNPLKVYCPNPVCSNVVTLSSETASRAKCKSCNTKFCVKCGGEHGLLMSCDWVSLTN